jgi:aryl-alcohol dehydrogenase-like predicted oxidoreductase
LLTGKYKRNAPMPEGARLTVSERFAERYMTEGNWKKVEALNAYCAKRGCSVLELSLGWLASQPRTTSVIAGATKPEQIEQNVRATDFALTADDLAEVDRITKAH